MILSWSFCNNHTWSKSFDSEDDLYTFVNTVGLVSHPDIVNIEINNCGEITTIKDYT